MKKIYLFLSTSLFLLLGGVTACDDNSLSHDEVNIPDPVVISDEDDGISAEPTTESVIRIQPENKHQEIDGFGCNFGWAEAVYGCMKREQIMDDLFGENGLKFNIYRGEVCASSASEDGNTFNFKTNENYHLGAHSSEQKTLFNSDSGKYKEYSQLWIIDYLCKRKLMDIYYFFSVWTPPVVWKSFGEGEVASGGSGSFNSEHSQVYAEFLTGFAKALEDKFGINVYGISGWNEPDQAMGGWDGCMWGNQQMADFTMDYLRPELNKQGLQDTKIIYGELPWWANAVTWVETSLKNNPNLADANIVAAGHGYSTVDANILPMPKAQTNAVVWWAGARQCTSTGENLLQTDAWDFSNSYYRIDRYYSIGQFSRYIQRGSTRVDVETKSTTANRIPKDLSASAYIKDDTYTIVLVNKSKSKAFDALLEIDGKDFDSMVSYTSSSSVKWLRKKLNPSSTGKRSVTVPKYSVVTITGRFK